MTRVLALGIVLLGAADAAAWTAATSPPSTWADTRIPVAWYLNDAGSADLDVDTVEREVRASFDNWQSVDCCSIGFNYRGRTGWTANGSSGLNVVSWTEGGWSYGSSAIAVTSDWYGGGRITEADIDCNGADYTWVAAAGGGNRVDLQSILTHEIGHFLGLGDLYDRAHSSSTMYGVYSGGLESRSLADDDMDGCRALYPEDCGQPPAACATDGDCGSGQICRSGGCVTRPPADLGRACDDPSDCALRVCRDGQCSAPCWPWEENPCGDGFVCSSVACGVWQCQPGAPGPGELGASCSGAGDCASGDCAAVSGAMRCVAPCDPYRPGTCGGSGQCAALGSGACGFCACGAGLLGDPCAVDANCQAGRCVALDAAAPLLCATECLDGRCPAGATCRRVSLPEGGGAELCVADLQPIAALCAADGDCMSGTCWDRGAGGVCTRRCDARCGCPRGTACATDATGEGWCVLDAGGDDGCGCAAPGGAPAGGPAVLAVLALGLALHRRRRRSATEPPDRRGRPGTRRA